MKRLSYFSSLVALAFCSISVFSLSSCTRLGVIARNLFNATEDSDSVSVDEYLEESSWHSFTDERYNVHRKKGSQDYSYIFDCSGLNSNQALDESIMEWVAECIGYEGTAHFANPKELFNAAIDQSSADNEDEAFEQEEEFTKIFENENCVTLQCSGYVYYEGAAHPMSWIKAITIRKSDGHRFQNDELISSWESVRPMAIAGLMQYFEVSSSAELEEELFLDGPMSVNLGVPQMGLYLTEKGLSGMYQQYEIAAYACGMPDFTIPYPKAKRIMTDQAVKLLE